MLRTRWHAGPATASRVLVAVTDFRVDRRRDLVAVARAGSRLAAEWPELSGAVGMWLWALPLRSRSGSISVWEDEDALVEFVRRDSHVRTVRRFHRAGTLTSHRWWAEPYDRSRVWQEAVALLRTSS